MGFWLGLEHLVELNGGALSRSILDLQYWTTASASSRDDGTEIERAAAKKMGTKGRSASNLERNTGDDGGEGEGKRKEISNGDKGDSIAKLMSLKEGGGLIEERGEATEEDEQPFFYGDALSNAFSALEKDGHLLGNPLHVERL